jgi:translation elongation factor EF-Tu-like GTPase
MRTSTKAYAYPADIEAEITFVPADQGGRSTPAFSGYRPQFYYDDHDWDADQEYPDVESVLPGQTVRALLRFASPDAHVGRVHPGMEFQVREGARIVARGRVTKILHLEESAVRVKSKT